MKTFKEILLMYEVSMGQKTVKEILEAVENGDMFAEDAEEAINKILAEKVRQGIANEISRAQQPSHGTLFGGCHY